MSFRFSLGKQTSSFYGHCHIQLLYMSLVLLHVTHGYNLQGQTSRILQLMSIPLTYDLHLRANPG